MPRRQYKKSPRQTSRVRHWAARHPYLTAFFAGFFYFTGVISWMFTIKTAEIAAGFAVQLVALSAGLIMVSSLAMGFVLFVWLMRRLKVRLSDPRALWIVPMLWIVAEYARAVLFSIVSLGPDGRVGPYWTFGDLGYYLASTPFAFIARFGGMYLLSGIVVLLVLATYQSWLKRSWKPIAPVVAVLASVSLAAWALYLPTSGRQITIGTARYPYKDTPTVASKDVYSIFPARADHNLDVLVLPEYSHFFEDEPVADKAVIQPLMKRDDSLIIHSARENVEGLGHNMLTFQAADGTVLNQQKKWFVVPAGEYVPYIYQVILAYAGQERLLLNFNAQKSVNRGDKVEAPYTFDDVRYGAHACSGVIAPDFYNQLAQQGSDIFTNSAALDTMGISPLFHLEGEQMNRLAAIAHAKPFVQAAKGGPAYILDKDGRQLAYSYARDGAVVEANVQTNSTKTLYGWLGDWVVYISIVGTAWLLIKSLAQSKKHGAKSAR